MTSVGYRDQRIEKVIQRLEHSVLRDSQGYQILGDDGTSTAKIPARIREIITKNLSHRASPASTMTSTLNPNVSQLTEENRLLAQELNRVENLLSESAAERDELGIKYNALSERLIRLMEIANLFVLKGSELLFSNSRSKVLKAVKEKCKISAKGVN
ncbi:hypothetical protein LOTGIDRAFT_169115 [Lottia gigantea]|uniref:Uncharacterized protein n=1 Tax=Lottia gigantea TaxID=225164 RepID=V3ZMG4_LOTGI|nr:hypothetical protein LOTGIDRAFT_169115 [Lottia gigantea]ESO83640.1 hypothetical protein LOTGIDRAFT_169115 [Lottia gigantea]